MAKEVKKPVANKAEPKKSEAPAVEAGTYEVAQDFSAWEGEEKTDYKKGDDASAIHPSKIQKYLDAGFIKKSAAPEE